MRRHLLNLFLCISLLLLIDIFAIELGMVHSQAYAEVIKPAPISALAKNDNKQSEQNAQGEQSDNLQKQPLANLPDTYGRDTPRGAVQGFMRALTDDDIFMAGSYLQLNQGDNPATVVREFKKALDAGGRLQTDMQLSNDAQGNLDDNLPARFDEVGDITYKGNKIPVKLIHVQDKNGNMLWLFSNDTLKTIPEIVANARPTLVEQYGVDKLSKFKLFGMHLSDMTAVLVLTVLNFAFMYVSLWLLYFFLKLVYPRLQEHLWRIEQKRKGTKVKKSIKVLPIKENIILPLALVFTSILLPEILVWTGVSMTMREQVSRYLDILAWVAMTWLMFRLIDTTSIQAEQISYKYKRVEQIAIIGLIRRMAKMTVVMFAMIFIFGNLGFDLTTGIATLGIGGLALALGAQKTIENLVGSLVVVADQPVRVGDYCKFGNYDGIVMDIGIRSTRVRTLERSVVTIPNGDFASMQIENFTAKDMFRFQHKLFLKRTAKIDVIHQMIRELDKFLNEHYLTNKVWNQMSICELRQDCYVLNCQAYIDANGMAEFFDKQNVVLIDLLKEVEKYDVEHALPTQQLVVEEEKTVNRRNKKKRRKK